MTSSINQSVKRETSELFGMVDNINKGSNYLAQLIDGKDDKKIEKVSITFEELYRELRGIGVDFYKITDFIVYLSDSFEALVAKLNLLAVLGILIALLLIVPRKWTKACGMSNPCVSVLTMAVSGLFLAAGVYMFYRT